MQLLQFHYTRLLLSISCHICYGGINITYLVTGVIWILLSQEPVVKASLLQDRITL